eukprot:TRINITY_DN9255_c0_g1_i4.p2 TRINITY_DN9255_c0_g1~~TRINITY_DN9255_c0_g1_i4.p2  ORF type:complete len:108 (-),score=14.98 TRINITY_DN9255_c0_g1_i4:299-622(-)
MKKCPEGKQIFTHVKLIEFLKIVYPEVTWERKKFMIPRQVRWSEREAVAKYLTSLEPVFDILDWHDWYRVSHRQVFTFPLFPPIVFNLFEFHLLTNSFKWCIEGVVF